MGPAIKRGPLPQLTLVLGGSRSGKSNFALTLAGKATQDHAVLFWATGLASDAEMKKRIAAHQKMRPAGWHLLEEPRDLMRGLEKVRHIKPQRVVFDSLTTWAGNMAHMPLRGKQPLQELERFLSCAKKAPCRWILVSDEIGLGVVPATPMGRAFRDLLGDINQCVAQAADQVHWVVAGMPQRIKPA